MTSNARIREMVKLIVGLVITSMAVWVLFRAAVSVVAFFSNQESPYCRTRVDKCATVNSMPSMYKRYTMIY